MSKAQKIGLLALGIITATLLVIVCLYVFQAGEKENTKELGQRLENVRNLGLGLAGIVGIFVVVWRGINHSNQAKAQLAQAKSSAKQAKTAVNAQLSQRFSSAVADLGTEDEYDFHYNDQHELQKELKTDYSAKRLGAIYSLESLLKDFLANDDTSQYWATIDLLCEYARKKTAYAQYPVPLYNIPENKNEREDWQNQFKDWARRLPASPKEVEVIMNILGRLIEYRRPIHEQNTKGGIPGLDLSHINLVGVALKGYFEVITMNQSCWLNCATDIMLSGCDFYLFVAYKGVGYWSHKQDTSLTLQWQSSVFFDIHLKDSWLEKVSFQETNFQEVVFEGVNLSGALFREINFQECYFIHGKLQGANLMDANLQKADLRMTDLQKAHLYMVDLQEADLQEADLQEAYLQRANLFKANLTRANLEEANLQMVNLKLADLHAAKLQKAELQGADLQEANLQEAELQGAFLHGARLDGVIGLTQEQLNRAHGNEKTTLPEGLTRPAHWTKTEDPAQESP
ncbi:MAG TPA: hypothetical protein DCP28_35880 [Cytophagales bacterium]|nr:hypothetical protein [Cytophagales bacterium]